MSGGFECGQKGYNPEDMGEWIMVRMSPRVRSMMHLEVATAADGSHTAKSPVAFHPQSLYTQRSKSTWIPFNRRCYAQVSGCQSTGIAVAYGFQVALFASALVVCRHACSSMLMEGQGDQTSFSAAALTTVSRSASPRSLFHPCLHIRCFVWVV